MAKTLVEGRQIVSASVEQAIADRLREIALQEDRSISSLIRNAIRHELERGREARP